LSQPLQHPTEQLTIKKFLNKICGALTTKLCGELLHKVDLRGAWHNHVDVLLPLHIGGAIKHETDQGMVAN
jgi:hypothetical protein